MQIPQANQLKYLTRRRSEIIELKESLIKGQFDLALKIGHQLKGNAATFGFPEFSEIGQGLEKAAQERDQSRAMEVIEKFDLMVEKNLKIMA